MASGFHSFVFKKDIQTIRRLSSDTADILDQIYQQYGAHAGYCAASAIKKIITCVDNMSGVGASNWQAELRECPQAMFDARRAVDVFLYDYGAQENSRWSRN